MENPSLQIGDNNWAAKDGSILGYNIIQDNYLPQTIDFTRASSATRVNAEGLIENAFVLGGELVTNGNFATDSDWNKNSNWTISGGTANCDGTNSNDLNQAQNIGVIGKSYKITFTITAISQGSIAVRIGSGATAYYTSVGTHSEIVTATTTDRIRVSVLGSAIASIDNVSVKEVITNNVPRIDYTGGGFGKLLLEPQRTNLFANSENYSIYPWANTDVNLTANYALSPDGKMNASLWEFPTTNNGARIQYVLGGVTLGATYTQSYYIKSLSGNLTLRIGTSGSLVGEFEDITATSEWQRFDFTSVASDTTEYPRIQNISGTQGAQILVYGAQIELGSYSTSLINTSGTAVTRLADSASKTGISSLINSTEGVLYAEISALESTVSQEVAFSISDGVNNRLLVRFKTDGKIGFIAFTNGFGIRASGETGVLNQSVNRKIALKYKENDYALWVNGIEVVVDTTSTTFPLNTLTKLSFEQGNNSNYFYGNVQNLMIFPSALSDTDLATLTTL